MEMGETEIINRSGYPSRFCLIIDPACCEFSELSYLSILCDRVASRACKLYFPEKMTDVYPAFVTLQDITLQDEINVYNILFLFFSVFFLNMI